MTENANGSEYGRRPSLRGRNGIRGFGVISLAALAVVVIGIAAGRSGGSSQAAAPAPPECSGAKDTIDRPEAVPGNLLPPGPRSRPA